jgi:putrescine aminotransferase
MTVTPSADGLNHHWPPFSRLAHRAEDRLTLVRGEGSTVWDDTGVAYLDATAGLWYANVGHGRQEIATAVADQLARLAAYSNFGALATGPTERLTRRLAPLLPLDDPLILLTSQGSDAVDSAVKIARRWHHLAGRSQRTAIISRERSYHGMHGFGTALAGITANHEGYAVPDATLAHRAPTADLEALEETVRTVGPDNVAAIIVEPVVGAGGVHPAPRDYLPGVRALCDRTGALMIADEVITGFGRLGTWFACEAYGVRPDLMTLGKGFTSGYLPLGGVAAAARVWEPFAGPGEMLRHGYTYSGHASACVAAEANLDIIEREGLIARVADLAPFLSEQVASLVDHPLVDEVRHAGLLAAVQLTDTSGSVAERATLAARGRGILTRALGGGALQVSPPFVITREEIRRIVTGLRDALDEVDAAGCER